MIDPFQEEIFPFAKINAKTGLDKDVGTYHRWRRPGVRNTRLEAVSIGGVYYTSVAALRRFFSALSSPTEGPGRPAPDDEREDHIVRELESRFGL